MTIYEAMTAECEKVPLSESRGRISAQTVCIYPPDVPVIVAGEEIEDAMIAQILDAKKRGCGITGCDPESSGSNTGEDDMIKVVKA